MLVPGDPVCWNPGKIFVFWGSDLFYGIIYIFTVCFYRITVVFTVVVLQCVYGKSYRKCLPAIHRRNCIEDLYGVRDLDYGIVYRRRLMDLP